MTAEEQTGSVVICDGKAAGPGCSQNEILDSDEEIVENVASSDVEKKKKSKKKKKSTKQDAESEKLTTPDIIKGGEKKGGKISETMWPPSQGIESAFPSGLYPKGEVTDYAEDHSRSRASREELAVSEKVHESGYNDLRKAAEVHRRIRAHVQKVARPGMSMTTLCETIENGTRALLGTAGLEAGIAFPTGVSLNHCAAHWTPNAGDTTVLQYSDVCKVDFGTHVGGRIIDSAFTLTFDPIYDPLKQAVREATETGLRLAGVDAVLGEIGEAIQEVMESYSIELGGRMLPIKAIRNLNGHSIERFRIHGGKSVPITRGREMNVRMEEGELYAIETFGSTGRGLVHDDAPVSHYMLPFNAPPPTIRLPRAKQLLGTIHRHFGTLAFCRRYLDRLGEEKYGLALKHLVDNGALDPYPPLVDSVGSYTAQYEHTILLRPSAKEVLSRGDDY
jgi:methionyl aminopeptidase